MDPSLQSSVGSEAKWPWAVLNACVHLPSSGWIQKVHGHLPYVNHIVGNFAGGERRVVDTGFNLLWAYNQPTVHLNPLH